MKANKAKSKGKGLSKSKQSIKPSIYSTVNRDTNKSIKSTKMKDNIRIASSDTKHKKFSKTKLFKLKIKNEEEKYLKQSQDTLNSKILTTDINYSRNLISEKKVKNSLNRLIDTSQTLLEQQNNIFLETDKLIQNIEVNEHEINKIQKRDNLSNFSKCVNDYTENLNNILSKLKKNTQEMEFSNKIKEENNNLKYKIQILSIDKNDDFRNLETELNSIKTVYSNEINATLRYLNELGFDNIPLEPIVPKNLTNDKIINFFNLIKRLLKQLKDDISDKEQEIKMISKYKTNEDNLNKNYEQKILSNTEYLNKINNEYSKYNTQNSFNMLNNNKIYNNLNNNNIINNNDDNLNNNDRIKKIEDLCLQHNYEDENQKSEINNKNSYLINTNNNEYKSNQSYIDNFQRSKNMANSESNISGLGIQLEHNYTDSYFYQNMNNSYLNKNDNISNNIDKIKDNENKN